MVSPAVTPQGAHPDPIAVAPPLSRTYSHSSDRPSIASATGFGFLSPPISVNPEPIFIAASAASQIVTNDHDGQSDAWFDQHGIEPSGETALVSPGALKLVNAFLDQLLFNFLSTSRSTSLVSLRPAVSEVLKPKLAREAISGADQELHEYLGGGEDEELLAFHNGLEPNAGDWDLELVWKRTRLRCMVYSSLGDMEEEDEDLYTEQEQLDGPPGRKNRFSNTSGVVSPAVAIFLTSILEFIGEQALIVAGQAAYQRLQSKYEKDEKDGTLTPSEIADRVVLEELDMERVALDRTLGRLWRGWKKRVRSPTTSISMIRSFSRESLRSRDPLSRKASHDGGETMLPLVEPQNAETEEKEETSADDVPEHEYAANIPIPVTDDDVREIEIPWLRIYPEDSDDESVSEDSEAEQSKRRPKSLMFFSTLEKGLPTPERSRPASPALLPPVSRKRSLSVPSPITSLSFKKHKSAAVDESVEEAEKTSGEGADIVATETDEKAEVPIESVADPAAGETEDKSHVLDTKEDVDMKDRSSDIEKEAFAETIPANSSDKLAEGEGMEDEHEKGSNEESKGLIAGVVAGATAIGVAAVAGIAAAARGEAPKTTVEETDGGEDLTEEPEILTSSRVSIGGRHSPDRHVPALSRHSSVRSHSVHSLRLVDVAGPKSPARSRHGSMDAADYLAARSSSVRHATSPITTEINRVASPVQRASTASPTMRNATASPVTVVRSGSAMSVRQNRHEPSTSISEIEERSNEGSTDDRTPIPLMLPDRSPLRAKRMDSYETKPSVSPIDAEEEPIPQASATVAPGSYSEPQFMLAPAPTPRASREVQTQPQFTLAQATTPRASREVAPQPETASLTPSSSTQTIVSNITHTVVSPQSQNLMAPAPGHESGVPPLTPLREMMEGAPDTSDEASSIAPSVEIDRLSEPSRYSPQSSHSRSFEKSRSRNTSIDAPIGVPTSQMIREEDVTPRADNFNRPPPRQLHTSGSASSVTSSNKLRAMRTSEESAKSDKGRSFEELIHSDQTIQYTLTPQTVREHEPVQKSPANATFIGTIAPPQVPIATTTTPEGARPRTSSSVKKLPGINGLSSNPPEVMKKPVVAPVIPAARSYTPTQTARSMASPSSQRKPGAPQARDARVDREPINDFAEFIRSTGPPGVSFPTKAAAATNGNRDSSVGQRNVSATVPRVSGPTPVLPRSASSANRARLQAREAIVPYGGNSSDLIDFIRQGPPATSRDNPRIPRTVAPFRTTMDSDQMAGAFSNKGTESVLDPRYSQASTDVSMQPSMHSSVTSQSALLNSNKASKPVQQRNMFDDENMMPQRKTRRVKDPYAIDFSDEEDDLFDEAPTPKKPAKGEESLIDFLNNVPPPPPQPTAPFEGVHKSTVTKKNSSPSLMSRFGRKDSYSSSKPQSSHSARPASSLRSNITTQVSSQPPIAAKYTTTSTSSRNYVSQLDGERKPSLRNVPQKQFQPRDPTLEVRKHQSATNELADFLMNTPPPPSMNMRDPEPFIQTQSKSSGFSGMFGRKKKMAAI